MNRFMTAFNLQPGTNLRDIDPEDLDERQARLEAREEEKCKYDHDTEIQTSTHNTTDL